MHNNQPCIATISAKVLPATKSGYEPNSPNILEMVCLDTFIHHTVTATIHDNISWLQYLVYIEVCSHSSCRHSDRPLLHHPLE